MGRPTVGGQRLHIILREDQVKALNAAAARSGLSVSAQVRKGVDFYLAAIKARRNRKKGAARG